MSGRTVAILGLALGCLFGLVSSGCSAPQERPPCRETALAVIEGQFAAEVLDACSGYGADECAAFPRIVEKYRAKREEWRTCQ